jgi:hypothetical protein
LTAQIAPTNYKSLPGTNFESMERKYHIRNQPVWVKRTKCELSGTEERRGNIFHLEPARIAEEDKK